MEFVRSVFSVLDQTAAVGSMVFAIAAVGVAAIAWLFPRAPRSLRSGRLRRLMRVKQIDPRALGVHDVVSLRTSADGKTELPEYISRDFDGVLRGQLSAAARSGGFILLVGGSSSGKTRSAYEAALATVPRWRLVQIDPSSGGGQLHSLRRRSVLWLDEIQKYLTTAETAWLNRSALAQLIATRSVVVLATVWPDDYQALLERSGRDQNTGLPLPDVNSRARDLLALAGEPILVPEQLSESELARATAAASSDARLKVALADPDFGFTQALTGAPLLIRRWQHAPPLAKAVIDTAVDCRRLGLHEPISRDLLLQCTLAGLDATKTELPAGDWFAKSLAYSAEPVDGVVAILIQSKDGRRYRLADYVFQHGQRTRFRRAIPASMLEVLVAGVPPGDDVFRLARGLQLRSLYEFAEPLYRRGARNGDGACGRGLALLLEEQGRTDDAVHELNLLVNRSDDDALELRVQVLERNGRLEALRRLAASGDRHAHWAVVTLLLTSRKLDEAVTELETLLAAGDRVAAMPLASTLAFLGRTDALDDLARRGHSEATAFLLNDRMKTPDIRSITAVARVRSLTRHGDPMLRREWIDLKIEAGEADHAVDQLRRLVHEGDTAAQRQLAQLLHRLGRHDDLQILADRGDLTAKWLLADLVADERHLNQLRELAATGNVHASMRLLEEDVMNDVARRTAPARGLRHAAEILLEQGRVKQAREMAATLATSDELRDRLVWARIIAGTGEPDVAIGILDELTASGAIQPAGELIELLVALERISDLRALAISGVSAARHALIAYLESTDRVEEATTLRRFGLNPDGSTPAR